MPPRHHIDRRSPIIRQALDVLPEVVESRQEVERLTLAVDMYRRRNGDRTSDAWRSMYDGMLRAMQEHSRRRRYALRWLTVAAEG